MRSYVSVPPGQAVPYRHRDPAFLSPERLAQLAEWDRRRALTERPSERYEQTAARQARITRYAALRKAKLSIPEAAIEMGISPKTARTYEAALRAARRNT